jgi:hypothetical protein
MAVVDLPRWDERLPAAPSNPGRRLGRCLLVSALRDPRTITILSCDGISAGKLICDLGEASSVPGNGNASRPRGEESERRSALPPEPSVTIKPLASAATTTACTPVC